MADSSTVSAGDQATAAQYNNVREDIVKSALIQLSSVAGTDTITATVDGQYDAYTTGSIFVLIPAGDNTGATTLNLSSLGAKAIKKPGASGVTALVAGDLKSGQPAIVLYDGTQFLLLSGVPEMYDFFAATDITGAQAETLTDASDADGLHSHGVSIVNGTRTTGEGTGNETIAHGLSVTPRWIEVYANSASNDFSRCSQGYYDGSTERCQYWYDRQSVLGNSIGQNATIIKLTDEAGDSAIATVSSMNATNVVLNFTTLTGENCDYMLIAHA